MLFRSNEPKRGENMEKGDLWTNAYIALTPTAKLRNQKNENEHPHLLPERDYFIRTFRWSLRAECKGAP